MVNFLRKRLQVFVSSTFSDLISERQAAVEAILTSGHIPAGMELFTSGDESQMEVIKQWIDESDIYLLILGGRYGSVELTSRKSYTQLEYEYAIQKSKPLFACVINENALEKKVLKSGSSTLETDNPSQLKDFRKLVLSRMVHFWDDTKDIKIAIGETISHFARQEDLLGWIRPHQEANMPALADEIARLSKENSALRSELANLRPEKDIHGLNFSELSKILKAEGLLDFLLEERDDLAVRYNLQIFDVKERIYAVEKLKKLCLYGLVVFLGNSSYQLTDEGRVYLNKLILTQIENDEQNN